MPENVSPGLMAIFIIHFAVCVDESISNQMQTQQSDYHYRKDLSQRPYSENSTNRHHPDYRGQGFFFQFYLPFEGRNYFSSDLENGEWRFLWLWKQLIPTRFLEPTRMNSQAEDFGYPFNEKCCRFEDRFLKNSPMFAENPTYPNINKFFLLDLSSQMSPEEWSHIQESLMLMMDNMCLDSESYLERDEQSDGQMITFMTTDGQVKHYHKESLQVDNIKQDIVHLQGYNRISCTTALLKKAYTYIDQYTDSSKSYTKHEVLLITDGRSTCHLPFFIEAKRLRSVAHVSVVTIIKNGGPRGRIHVTDIASDSSTDNIYSFQSCQSFLDMMKHINKQPCRRCSRIEPN